MIEDFDDQFSPQGNIFDEFLEDSEFLTACDDMRRLESFTYPNDRRLTNIPTDFGGGTAVVKSSKKVTIGKFRNKIFRPRGGEIDNNAAIRSVQCKKQLRRRGDQAMLYAFPSFDRCDSLLFLPSTMTGHINTSDLGSLGKLLSTHMDKNCSVRISHLGDAEICLSGLLRFHTLLHELNPDAIVCVHNTKVVENQIVATAYAKHTVNKTIYNSVARSTKDPLFEPMFGPQCDDRILRNLQHEGRLSEETRKLSNLVMNMDSGCDLLLYMRLDLVFTFDDFTKKITRYDVTETLTSTEPVCVDYSP